ncbi:MAG: hypothetical protein AAGA68_09255 [Pseudomonadota bacterium]
MQCTLLGDAQAGRSPVANRAPHCLCTRLALVLATAYLLWVPASPALACSCFYSREELMDVARHVFIARAGEVDDDEAREHETHSERFAGFAVVEQFLGDPHQVTDLRVRYRTDNVVTTCSNGLLTEGALYLVVRDRAGPAYLGSCAGVRPWDGDEESLAALRAGVARRDALDPGAWAAREPGTVSLDAATGVRGLARIAHESCAVAASLRAESPLGPTPFSRRPSLGAWRLPNFLIT